MHVPRIVRTPSLHRSQQRGMARRKGVGPLFRESPRRPKLHRLDNHLGRRMRRRQCRNSVMQLLSGGMKAWKVRLRCCLGSLQLQTLRRQRSHVGGV